MLSMVFFFFQLIYHENFHCNWYIYIFIYTSLYMCIYTYLLLKFCFIAFHLEKEMATHSSILPWRIPWTEEPGGLQSTGSQRVGHDWATDLIWYIYGFPDGSDDKESICSARDLGSILGLGRCPGGGNGNPLQYSSLENPIDRGAWWATVHGVIKSWTQLSDFIFTFHFHALEKEMATHSSVLAWRIPGTAEPSGLPSMGSHRVGHDWSDLAAVAAATLCYSVLYFFSY